MENKKNTEKNVKKTTKKVKERKIRKIKERKITDLEGKVIKKEKLPKKDIKGAIKKHFRKYRKLYRLLLLIILAIVLIFGIYIGIRNYILNKKYGKYEKKMNDYGFSIMYDNESPESSERVTKIEMIKIILSSIYNTNQVESIGFGPQDNFDGDEWATTAEAFGIIEKGYITEKNYDEVVTYKEALIAYLKARINLMDMPLSNTKESSFKNLQTYSQEEKQYINDAAEKGIIENNNKKLDLESKMFKGQFNELVVRFVETYNTVAPEGDTLVLKEESKPKNADIYPYILYSVPKEVYEYKGVNEGGVDYETPVETYKYDKDYYKQMKYRTEYYYNAILNVNYNSINKEEFKSTAMKFLRYDYSEEINQYVDYIIQNKIIIEGKATVQLPIFYLDGVRFRARVKLSFEIKNSDTDKNVLLGDLDRTNEVTYTNNKYEIYIDAPMGTTLLSKALMLDMEPIIDLMVSEKLVNANEI